MSKFSDEEQAELTQIQEYHANKQKIKLLKQQLQQAREEGRKEAAQEITDELTVVIEDDLQCISCCRDFIKAKFGLEGKR